MIVNAVIYYLIKDDNKENKETWYEWNKYNAYLAGANAFNLIAFNLIIFPFLECGTANQEIRIVGGRPTGINQYPWLARLVYDGQFHCGASLLTPGEYSLNYLTHHHLTTTII